MGAIESEGTDWGLLGRAVLAGTVAGATLFAILLALGWGSLQADTIVFSLSGLPFSIGLIGWSTVLISGNAIEGFSREFGISESFTVEGSRQAMALLTAFGAGGMIASSIAAMALGV
jgi:hypothetical protein